MKYLLFDCDSYYPLGGWDDLQGIYDSEREALANFSRDNGHIVEWDGATLVKTVELTRTHVGATRIRRITAPERKGACASELP